MHEIRVLGNGFRRMAGASGYKWREGFRAWVRCCRYEIEQIFRRWMVFEDRPYSQHRGESCGRERCTCMANEMDRFWKLFADT